MISARMRLWLLLSTLMMVLAGARPAFAQAFYCDLQGNVELAPPPLLQVADIRWEQAQLFLYQQCGKLLPALSSELRSDSPKSPPPESPSPLDWELAILPQGQPVLGLIGLGRLSPSPQQNKGPRGYQRGIFRPPRF